MGEQLGGSDAVHKSLDVRGCISNRVMRLDRNRERWVVRTIMRGRRDPSG